MMVIVLVHGGNVSADTWNRVVGRADYPSGEQLGGRVWDRVTGYLGAEAVYAPTLLDEYDFGLSAHISQLIELITREDMRQVVLVGHSYGGMVITGVAAELPARIKRLVYVDAALPQPGQSLFTLLESAGFTPQKIIDGKPRAYVEPIEFDPAQLQVIPKTYVFCTSSEFASLTELARNQINTHRIQWTTVDLPTNHLPMATMPQELAKIIYPTHIDT